MKKTLFVIISLFTCISLHATDKNSSFWNTFMDFFSASKKSTLITNKYRCATILDVTTNIHAVSSGSWQNAATWSTNTVPNLTDRVEIPEGIEVTLVGNANAKSITVLGSLKAISGQANNAAINLSTEWLLVKGENASLEIGTPSQPYIADEGCVITLVGEDDGETIGSMGDKFIGAMEGGTIVMEGLEKISWTHLGNTASAGATTIELSEAIDWKVGDEIIITSSRTNWNEAEKRTITSITDNKLAVSFSDGLRFPHFSVLKTYTRETDGKTWTANLRAEVGLLSHNIKIQGDTSSETNGFGGHIMAMSNSTIKGANIELYRMGQKSKMGRYPWHWHLLHEFGNGQYLKNSSIHSSFNRAVTIHGTSSTLVDNNFLYDHIGHGVFLEDGSERFNVIRNNVALLTKRPKKGEELIPSDNELNQVQNRTPATFWITNPNNIFENNVAAGTHGTGFWFALPLKILGASATDSRYSNIEPIKESLGSFKGNKGHSCMSGFDIFDALRADHSIIKNVGWNNSERHLIEDCTWYANDLGVYTGLGGGTGIGVENRRKFTSNLIFENNIFIDNVTGMMLASYNQVNQSVIVANSGTGIYNGPRSLYRMYDGAGQISNSHLVGWTASNTSFLRNGGASFKNTNHRLSGITTNNNRIPRIELPNYNIPILKDNSGEVSDSYSKVWNVVLLDTDGSFSGVAGSSIVSNHPLLLVGDEVQPGNWTNAYRSPHRFVLNYLFFPGMPRDQSPNLTIKRTKTGTPTSFAYDAYGVTKDHIQFPFIVNEDYMYTYTFESLPEQTKNIDMTMDNAESGDNYIVCFKDFGKLGGLTITHNNEQIPERRGLTQLKNTNANAFFKDDDGNLFIKFLANGFRQTINISWDINFDVPMLDSDNDTVSDRDEIINGTNPFDLSTLTLSSDEILADTNNNFNITYQSTNNSLRIRSNVNTNTPTTVQLYNITGKNVYENNIAQLVTDDTYSLKVSELTPGIYLVVIHNSKVTQYEKILIE